MIQDDYEKAISGLIPITQDLVLELKRRGRWSDANNLVETFRNQCVKEMSQEKHEINAKNKQIKMVLAEKEGVCVKCGLRPAVDGKRYCVKCLSYKKGSYLRKRREIKRRESVKEE